MSSCVGVLQPLRSQWCKVAAGGPDVSVGYVTGQSSGFRPLGLAKGSTLQCQSEVPVIMAYMTLQRLLQPASCQGLLIFGSCTNARKAANRSQGSCRSHLVGVPADHVAGIVPFLVCAGAADGAGVAIHAAHVVVGASQPAQRSHRAGPMSTPQQPSSIAPASNMLQWGDCTSSCLQGSPAAGAPS